uniref:Secreted protein n=1 Tax=Arundo donax TaxID=35708 RepID=A0A0A9AKE0_ARUDO
MLTWCFFVRMMTCNLFAGLACATKCVLLKYNIFQAYHKTVLGHLLELAHSYMRKPTMPKPTQRSLGEETCY